MGPCFRGDDTKKVMRLHIVAHGRIGRSPEASLVDRYLGRIAWPVTLTELSDAGAGKVPDLPQPAVTVLLDERGTALTSRALADRLARWRDDGMREARFVIGPADGHGEAARDGGVGADRLRPGDVAAPARPRDARRTAVPRDLAACRSSLSPRWLMRASRIMSSPRKRGPMISNIGVHGSPLSRG